MSKSTRNKLAILAMVAGLAVPGSLRLATAEMLAPSVVPQPVIASSMLGSNLLCGRGWHWSWFLMKCLRNWHKCPDGQYWIPVVRICVPI
jgi:hypothetical protein